VLNQSYKNYEYIVVDGKSNDRTPFILNKYKSKITIISEKDNGMYDAIKKGFGLAKGRYFLWINSDDFLVDNNSLLRAYNYLKKTNNQWIIANISITQDDKKTKHFFPLHYPRAIIKAGLAHNCFWGFLQQENTIFSQKLYKKSGGINPSFKMAGDFDLWRKFAKYQKLTSVPIKFATHRKWSNQLTNLNYYYSEIGKKKCIINFFYMLRFIYSFLVNFITSVLTIFKQK